ncbi:unnamed protein product [Heligmosomoides polygyrus]|uniref:AAA_12 domain-containing protein n=1 Tax=Heligmosomoides polygyrus TaxID=6339 RepID=A0A183FNE5_HELPZ|nr:unnamed protein product [Heligmosomoides polygyrus]
MSSKFVRSLFPHNFRQLAPHIRCPRTASPAQYGARGVIDLLVSKEAVPVASLCTTYRAHSQLNTLPSSLFYSNALVSGTSACNRRLFLDNVRCRNENIPFLFVNVSGTSIKSVGGSHSNTEELNACSTIIEGLLRKGIPSSSLAIITFYKDQFRRLEQFSHDVDVDLHTVDSVQGREKDVVLLLTTRTGIEASSGAFLDDALRMNVALTRSRHGTFVLGSAESLRALPNWSRVL